MQSKPSWRRRYYRFNCRWQWYYKLLFKWSLFSFLLSAGFQVIWTVGDVLKNNTPSFITIVHAQEQPPETIEQLIRRIAGETNFQWPDYLVRLAKCETAWTLDPFTLNTKGNKPVGSADRGLYGINDYWHKEVTNEQAFDPEWSTRWTIERINTGYQHEWMCDPLIRANPHKYD